MIGLLQHEAGEPPSGIGPGVNSNAVGPDLGLFQEGMAVDHHLAVIDIGIKGLPSNRQQISFILLGEGHTGHDPGMNKQIIALHMIRLEDAEEFQML